MPHLILFQLVPLVPRTNTWAYPECDVDSFSQRHNESSAADIISEVATTILLLLNE